MNTATVDPSQGDQSMLPVPVAEASEALARRENVQKLLVQETPGSRLGVSRSYFLALVEKHDLSLAQVETLVIGLRMNLEFAERPSIPKMAELLSLGASVEEIEAAYMARETICRELSGSPLKTTSALWALIECARTFVEGDLDGEDFGRMLAEAYREVERSGWRIRSMRRLLELSMSEAERLGTNQLESVASMIAGSREPSRS